MEFIADQYDFFEKKLATTLHPVNPNPEFIERLKNSLGKTPAVIVEKNTNHLIYLIVGAGLFSGALLMWFLNRKK